MTFVAKVPVTWVAEIIELIMTKSFEMRVFFHSSFLCLCGGAILPVTSNQQTPRNEPIKSPPGNKSIALFDNFKICMPGIVCPNDFPPTWIKNGLFDRLRYLSFGRLTNAYFSITFFEFFRSGSRWDLNKNDIYLLVSACDQG